MSAALANPYHQFVQELRDSPLNATPAEAHGLLCGLLCAGAPEAEREWQRELFAPGHLEIQDEECHPILTMLAEKTRREIASEDLVLSLLLPDDESPLRERAEGLYDWTRGFLLGMGLAGLEIKALSVQARELLDDLMAITRLDLDNLHEGEEEESDFMELREFLWVAVRLLYEEVANGRTRTPVGG